MLRVAAAAAVGLAGAIACQEPELVARRGHLPVLVGDCASPLFLQYPDLDQRIEQRDLDRGTHRVRVIYLDRWYPDLSVVRDFAVDRHRLYALLGAPHDPDDPRLFVIDLDRDSLVRTLVLPPVPQRLAWDASARRLIVGHGTAPAGAGPPGRLTVVDVGRLAVVGSVSLAGACISTALAGDVVHAVERTVRARGDEVVVTSALVSVDLPRMRVGRRIALPPGARQVVFGPSGLLYVAHASGHGALETDGTITALEPGTLAAVDRLRLGMVVRRMAVSDRYLVLNALSTAGETWLSLVDGAHRTVYDRKLDSLSNHELTLVGPRAYTAPRRGDRLAWIDLQRLAGGDLRLASVTAGGATRPAAPAPDRPGMLRARVRAVEVAGAP